MLKSGNNIKILADSVMTFLIGNANGLKMNINGKDEGRIGKKGEIIPFMKVTSKGIVAKKIKKESTIPVKESKIDTSSNN